MAKVTSKFQVTLPKAIAEEYGIQPGDQIDWIAAGDVIRVVPPGKQTNPEDKELRVRLFDLATKRIARRTKERRVQVAKGRGWKREDLYRRGRSR